MEVLLWVLCRSLREAVVLTLSFSIPSRCAFGFAVITTLTLLLILLTVRMCSCGFPAVFSSLCWSCSSVRIVFEVV